MNIESNKFHGFLSSILPSQSSETFLSKQPVLSDYGNVIRSLINQLPPELTSQLTGDYREPTPDMIREIEDAILLREFSIERAEKEASLDAGWLASANTNIDTDNDDEWNIPSEI